MALQLLIFVKTTRSSATIEASLDGHKGIGTNGMTPHMGGIGMVMNQQGRINQPFNGPYGQGPSEHQGVTGMPQMSQPPPQPVPTPPQCDAPKPPSQVKDMDKSNKQIHNSTTQQV